MIGLYHYLFITHHNQFLFSVYLFPLILHSPITGSFELAGCTPQLECFPIYSHLNMSGHPIS
jgi:hypothetical protein